MKTLIVTGGIATGKSTFIRLLMKAGGTRLRLFAGAGIMPDSDPDLELTETEAKMRPLLDALGV